MPKKLVLFDVDQTLINSTGSGRRALQKALQDLLKIPNALENISLHGKTDPQIVFEALEKIGQTQALTANKNFIMWEQYLRHLELELKESKEAHILKGVIELLKELKQDDTTAIALLTGNIKRGAEIKLKHFNLWDFFEVGGFGDDNPDRNIVAKIALERCRDFFKEPFSPENVFVVGDSVRDSACAKAIQAKAVLVATGLDSYTTLEAEKPFALFHDFSDYKAVLKILQVSHRLPA